MAKLFLPIALQLCCILLAATTCRANARLKATQHTSIYTKRNTRSLLQGTDCEYDSECSSDDTYFCDNGYCTRSECVTDDDCLDDYYCDGGTCYALNDTEDAPYDSPSPSPTQDYAPYEPYDSPSPSPSPRPTYTPVPTTTRPPVTTPSLTPTTPIGNQTPSSGTSGTASPSYSGVTTPSSRPTNPIGNQTTSSGVSGTASPSPSDGGSGGGGLSVGAIVGIVVGIVAVVGAIAGVGFYMHHKKSNTANYNEPEVGLGLESTLSPAAYDPTGSTTFSHSQPSSPIGEDTPSRNASAIAQAGPDGATASV